MVSFRLLLYLSSVMIINAEASSASQVSSVKIDRAVGIQSFIFVSTRGSDNAQQEEKPITWKSLTKKEREEKRRRFETWVKTKLSPEERDKLLVMFKDKKITDKELREFVETLFRKYGKPT